MDKQTTLTQLISLHDKRALITGAAGGIGQAIARRYAEAGADLELVDMDAAGLACVEQELSGFDVQVRSHVVDLSSKKQIEALWNTLGDGPDILGKNAGVELKHAAYRGTQPAMLDLLGGNISAVSGPIGDITQHLSTGKVRILGVSGTKRSRFAPNVPTFEEQGVKGASHSEWFAFLLPPKANADVVARMNAALKTTLAAPDVVEGLAGFGLEAMSSSPAELAELLKRDTAKWGPIVKQIGFTAEG